MPSRWARWRTVGASAFVDIGRRVPGPGGVTATIGGGRGRRREAGALTAEDRRAKDKEKPNRDVAEARTGPRLLAYVLFLFFPTLIFPSALFLPSLVLFLSSCARLLPSHVRRPGAPFPCPHGRSRPSMIRAGALV